MSFRSRNDLETLSRQLGRLNRIQDRRKLYPEILQMAMRTLKAESSSLLLKDHTGAFQVRSTAGIRPLTFEVSHAQLFLKALERHRHPVTRSALVEDQQWAAVKSEGLRFCVQFNCEMVIPLFLEERLVGILNLSQRTHGRYGRSSQHVLEILAAQCAMAIHNGSLYEELLSHRRHLEELATLKHQLLANVSHELRTPLTSIIGLSEMIAEGGDGPVNNEQIDHLVAIRHAGMKLLETLSLMLDLSKIEARQLALTVHKVDLRKLITNVLGEIPLNPLTAMDVELDQATPGIYGDEPRLRQVFKHLLENAAKFTKRGHITVAAEKSGEMLKVCVRDTGIGIPADQQGKIFDTFIQGDGSMTREYQGLGLGLSISRRIVELHGGRLWLASRQGSGSSFYLTLPLKPVGSRQQELSAIA